jgi:hypothetical protein
MRILLTIVLPVALPLLLYIGYVTILRSRAQAAGEKASPDWQEGPWLWLLLGGAGLALAILLTLRLTGGVPPGTKLEAPRLIDGRVQPSHVVE